LAYIFIISPIIVISIISSHSASVNQVDTVNEPIANVVSNVSIIFQADIYTVQVLYNIALVVDVVSVISVCILDVAYTFAVIYSTVQSKSVLGVIVIKSLAVVSTLYVYRLFGSSQVSISIVCVQPQGYVNAIVQTVQSSIAIAILPVQDQGVIVCVILATHPPEVCTAQPLQVVQPAQTVQLVSLVNQGLAISLSYRNHNQ
jgi:hypothetical protein